MNAKHLIEPEKIQELIRRVTVRITQQVAQIDLQLSPGDFQPGHDLCAVYTTIEGTYRTRLVLCAERQFLHRMTENMLGDPNSYPEDLEEYSKEFFNILCGRIVGEIHQEARAGASFRPPCFVEGPYMPDIPCTGPSALIRFTSDQNENVVVLHDEILLT